MIKLWKDVQDTDLKSLTVEVLSLDHLPGDESTRPQALYRFFNALRRRSTSPIMDPADQCGEIQPELDMEKAKAAISAAAKASWQAVNAQDRGDTDRAGCLWRSIFGDAFPEPEGGCANDQDVRGNEPAPAFNLRASGRASASRRPRPVRDAPQG